MRFMFTVILSWLAMLLAFVLQFCDCRARYQLNMNRSSAGSRPYARTATPLQPSAVFLAIMPRSFPSGWTKHYLNRGQPQSAPSLDGRAVIELPVTWDA